MNTQNDMKRNAALEAVKYVPPGEYIGVGTGSTVAYFIEALGAIRDQVRGAVSTSESSTRLLQEQGIRVVDLAEAGRLSLYVDGADEVNHSLHMIKGGGAALLAEKVVASAAKQFVCIADESKYVSKLGAFPLPVEVVPFARAWVATELIRLGGSPQLRLDVTTLGGHQILDVSGLNLDEPMKMEDTINRIPGVMENGLFGHRPADVLLLGRADGSVQVLQAR